MKITVKDIGTDRVKCDNCGWEGEIQDADWMQESEFGWCPDCGSEDQFTKKEEEEEIDIIEWQWDGWKARLAVYSIIAGIVIFGIIPWLWGVIDILRRIF